MKFRDSVYGEVDIPSRLVPLFNTLLGMRARNITMGTVPNALIPLGPFPSRFQHGVGAMYLALITAKQSNLSEELTNLLAVSALMHDWGNPPFAHLTEPFLGRDLSYNGESFLLFLIENDPDLIKILDGLGLEWKKVVYTVMGQEIGISNLVHGSLDVDNLDNLARAHQFLGLTTECHDPEYLAKCFAYHDDNHGDTWHFKVDLSEEGSSQKLKHQIMLWEQARRYVYEILFSGNHTISSSMLFMVMFHLSHEISIDHSFYELDDVQAFSRLKKLATSNPRVARVLESLERWNFFQTVFSDRITEPSDRLRALVGNWENRFTLAEQFASKYKIEPEEVTLFLTTGHGEREINVPIHDEGGWRTHWDIVRPKEYLIQLNLDSRHVERLGVKAEEFVQEHIL